MKAGRPEIVESEAFVLISTPEEKRSAELKALEANIDEGQSRRRALKSSMSKGWFGNLEDYVSCEFRPSCCEINPVLCLLCPGLLARVD